MENNPRCFVPCDILLPRGGFETFACVACDQHTSDPEYWERIDAIIGNNPSARRMILPEAFLGEPDVSEQISSILETTLSYIEESVFETYRNAFILVKRTLRGGGVIRTGLVGALNLECYEYQKPGSVTAPSEETVPERLPPRMEVLRAQAVESSHVIALLSDPDKTIIEPLCRLDLPKLYDFTLMEGGGRIEGYLIEGELAGSVSRAIDNLPGTPKIVVGDGNHSLAAAKAVGRNYFLAELCNVYDAGIVFEPIHRAVFGAEKSAVIEARNTGGVSYADLIMRVDEAIEKMPHTSIDYIHGEAEAREMVKKGAAVVILPAMEKDELFKTVASQGKFPRKSFSIGEAEEKRYYLECKIPE